MAGCKGCPCESKKNTCSDTANLKAKDINAALNERSPSTIEMAAKQVSQLTLFDGISTIVGLMVTFIVLLGRLVWP
jgi:hypothetical protein